MNFQKKSKVLNLLWSKVISTQISHSQVKNCDQQLETKSLLVSYKEKNRKMPIKRVKMKISKKSDFFLMSQGSLNPKIPRPKGVTCSLRTDTQTHRHSHTQTDRQTHRVTTEGTLSGFQDFFLQPTIKDRPNKSECLN